MPVPLTSLARLAIIDHLYNATKVQIKKLTAKYFKKNLTWGQSPCEIRGKCKKRHFFDEKFGGLQKNAYLCKRNIEEKKQNAGDSDEERMVGILSFFCRIKDRKQLN